LWKRGGLLLFWLLAAVVLISVGEKHLLEKTIDVPQGEHGKCKLYYLSYNNYKYLYL